MKGEFNASKQEGGVDRLSPAGEKGDLLTPIREVSETQASDVSEESVEDLSRAIVSYRRDEGRCQPHKFSSSRPDSEDDFLGHGAYGDVYKVQCESCHHVYAKKVIRLQRFKSKASRDKHLQDTDGELRCYMTLEHPHILAYVHHLLSNTQMQIYMEYCQLGDLHDLIAKSKVDRRPLPDEFAWHILEGLASALARCHDGLIATRETVRYSGFEDGWSAILHRDIKPGNVLLARGEGAEKWVPKLGDFGTSFKLDRNGKPPSTQTAGTRVFWAPEIAEEERKSSRITKWSTKSDIWGVGAVLHNILTAQIPTQAQAQSLEGRIQRLQQLAPEGRTAPFSDLLARVVCECLGPCATERLSALQLLPVAMKSENSRKARERSESFWSVMLDKAPSEVASAVVTHFVSAYLPLITGARIMFSPKEITLIMALTYRHSPSLIATCHRDLCAGFVEDGAGHLTGGTAFHALACLPPRDEELVRRALDGSSWASAQALSRLALQKNKGRLLPSNLAALVRHQTTCILLAENEERARLENYEASTRDKRDKLRRELGAHASEEFECTVSLLTYSATEYRLSSSQAAKAMIVSVKRGYFNLVRKLMEVGVSPSLRGKSQETGLHISAGLGDVAMTRLFLEKHANLDERDQNRRTPLHWAAWAGQYDTVQELLGQGADVDARDDQGRTALYGAAGGGFVDVVCCLISHGADKAIRGGTSRETALERARKKDYVDVIELLGGRE